MDRRANDVQRRGGVEAGVDIDPGRRAALDDGVAQRATTAPGVVHAISVAGRGQGVDHAGGARDVDSVARGGEARILHGDARRSRLVVKTVGGLVEVHVLNRGARRAGEEVQAVPGARAAARRRQRDRLRQRTGRRERAGHLELTVAGVETGPHDVRRPEVERHSGVDRQRHSRSDREIPGHRVRRARRRERGIRPKRAIETRRRVGHVRQRPEIRRHVAREARRRVRLEPHVARRIHVERIGRQRPGPARHAAVVRRVPPHVGVAHVHRGIAAERVAVEPRALVRDVGVLDVDRRAQPARRLRVDTVAPVRVDGAAGDRRRRVGVEAGVDVDTSRRAAADEAAGDHRSAASRDVDTVTIAERVDAGERRGAGADVQAVARDLEGRVGDGDDVARGLIVEPVDGVLHVSPADAHHGRRGVGDEAIPGAGGGAALGLEDDGARRGAVDGEGAFDSQLDLGRIEPTGLSIRAGELHEGPGADRQERAGGDGDVTLDDVGAPCRGPRLIDDVAADDRRRARERRRQQDGNERAQEHGNSQRSSMKQLNQGTPPKPRRLRGTERGRHGQVRERARRRLAARALSRLTAARAAPPRATPASRR